MSGSFLDKRNPHLKNHPNTYELLIIKHIHQSKLNSQARFTTAHSAHNTKEKVKIKSTKLLSPSSHNKKS